MFSFDIITHLYDDVSAAESYITALESIQDSILAEDFSRALQISLQLEETIRKSSKHLNETLEYVANPLLRCGFKEITQEEFASVEKEFAAATELSGAEAEELLGATNLISGNV